MDGSGPGFVTVLWCRRWLLRPASLTSGRRMFRKAGGVNPTRVTGPVGRYLSWSEREEIAALAHAGHGVREVARRLGRDPGTISRELDRGWTRQGYRASVAQAKADRG